MSAHDRTPTRRRFLQIVLVGAGGVLAGRLVARASSGGAPLVERLEDLGRLEWGFVVDTTRCIGCGSCVRACALENDVPATHYRTWVERYEIDRDEQVHVDSPEGAIRGFRSDSIDRRRVDKAFFVPKLCNHCRSSACTQVCPVGASFDSPDGVVLVDRERCVGCGYCVQACPYGCRYVDEAKGTADKCTLCYHRLHRGMRPACVEACPRQARLCGDLRSPDSPIRRILADRRYGLLKPEMGTDPKCYYLGLDLEVR